MANFITKSYLLTQLKNFKSVILDGAYLGKTAKAASATTADSATTAGSATKATQDASGNVITTTYATKVQISDVAHISDDTTNLPAGDTVLYSSNIVDALTSTVATNALSAKQGKVLNDKAEELNKSLTQLAYGEHGSDNIWDEQWESGDIDGRNGTNISSSTYIRSKDFCECEQSTQYYCVAPQKTYFFEYDANKSFVKMTPSTNVAITTQATTKYFKVSCEATTYGNNIAIVKGASGTYEPYLEYSVKGLNNEVTELNRNFNDEKMLGYSIPSDFPIQNEVSGNQYIQRVARIDMGGLTWSGSNGSFSIRLNDIKNYSQYSDANIFCYKYPKSIDTTTDKAIRSAVKYVAINDSSYTTSAEIKASLQGEYLYYELETPITKNVDGNECVVELMNDVVASNAPAHNAIYRGKYLGNALTSAQKTQISAGTFNDLFIGDYWTIGGVNYRIASFDYWLNSGDAACTTHHVVIVPDTCLYNAKMNNSNTTVGAYVGSAMYTSNLANAKATISSAFGSSNILSVRRLFTNAVSNGKPSAGSWYDSTVDLMDECMVYGYRIFTPENDGSTIPYNYTTDYKQLRLFALAPQFICNRRWCWLNNVVSSTFFAGVGDFGDANYLGASYSGGVRPAFAIKG